jgi:cytochrome c oxidase subunit 3
VSALSTAAANSIPGTASPRQNGDTRSAGGLRALDPKRLGLWVFLATVTMLFAAFSSAYLVRMASGGWTPIELPAVLWLTTVTILASSAAIEMASLHRGSTAARWLTATFALGMLFLAGQAAAWRALQAAGVFLPQSPHAAFLYVFTALHGAHLVGGLVWITLLRRVARRRELEPRDGLERCVTYWHFMGGLWVYLFAVLHLR